MGASQKKIIVQHMGINIDYFDYISEPCNELNVYSNKVTRILSTGRFVEKKGFKYIVSAMKYLPECTLEIVGDGPLLTNILKFISDNNITERNVCRCVEI